MSALDSGKSLVAQMLAKLPEGVRTIVAAELERPEAVDAVTLLGDSALARSDYSRQLDQLTRDKQALDALKTETETWKTQLDSWYQANQPKIEGYDAVVAERDRLKTGTPNPNPAPNPSPTAGLTLDDVNKAIAANNIDMAGVLAVTTRLSTDHYAKFSEVLDIQDVITKATQTKTSLVEAYKALHADKLTAHAKKAEDAEFERRYQARLAEERKTSPLPFPTRAGTPETSALDTLTMTQEQRTQRYTAEAAADRYEQLVGASGRPS